MIWVTRAGIKVGRAATIAWLIKTPSVYAIFVLILVAACGESPAPPPPLYWTRQSSGTTQRLRGVSGYGGPEDTVIAVGDGGIILLSENHGKSWAKVFTAPADLLAVGTNCCDTAAIAVGRNGTIVRSRDFGSTWQIVASGTQATLNTVTMEAAWGTGTEPPIQVIGGDQGTVLTSTDDGKTWQRRALPTNEDVHGAASCSTPRAVIVGSAGLVAAMDDFQQPWRVVASPTEQRLNTVSCSFFHFIFAGDGGTVLHGSSVLTRLTPIVGATNASILGTERLGPAMLLVGKRGTSIQLINPYDAEKEWSAVTDATGVTDDLHAVWGDDESPQNLYAVGAAGTILHATRNR